VQPYLVVRHLVDGGFITSRGFNLSDEDLRLAKNAKMGIAVAKRLPAGARGAIHAVAAWQLPRLRKLCPRLWKKWPASCTSQENEIALQPKQQHKKIDTQ
jgi:hypothetical protein